MRKLPIMFLILFLAIGAWFSIAWVKFLHTPITSTPAGVKFKVRSGTSYRTVSNELYQQHIIKHPHFLNLLLLIKGGRHHLKAGEYLFLTGTTPDKLIHQLMTGTGLVYHTFTIIPGTTFKQIRQILDNDPNLIHTTKNLTDAEIMTNLGQPGVYPEGEFFPDTYFFMKDAVDLTLLKRANRLMQQKLDAAWPTRTANLPILTPYQALIAASIIEKEAHVRYELPIIAGVMMNRLRQGILLQFDPTVIYGMGRYDGTIYKTDLANNNPYNTYIHKGLPPTPISMPGLAAINAVLHPESHDYLYFVAKGDHATHQFSRTLFEHAAAVIAFRKSQIEFFNTALVKNYLSKVLTKPDLIIN